MAPGECFGLLGPNGAGKTTTLRLCLGLIDPDAGDIELLGEPVPSTAREARARVGVVPQIDNLDPDFTVAENLLVYGRYFGLPPREVRARTGPLLEFAGLDRREGAKINTLSGGMKRRLTLARALVNDPRAALPGRADHRPRPAGAPPDLGAPAPADGQGKTLILTTHFMDEAERLCQRLAIMDHGRIIASGSPRELIAQHIEPEVVEVHGPASGGGSLDGVRKSSRGKGGARGRTVFCYADEVDGLLRTLAGHPELVYLHRPASLEDVFLKLTGRDLRD